MPLFQHPLYSPASSRPTEALSKTASILGGPPGPPVPVNPDAAKLRLKLLGLLAAGSLASGAVGYGVTGGFGRGELARRTAALDEPDAKQASAEAWRSLFGAAGKAPTGAPPPPPKPETINVESPRWFRGDAATHIHQIPWALPAALATTVPALLAGSHLARRQFHGKIKEREQAAVDQAEQDFRQALAEGQPDAVKASAAIDRAVGALIKAADGNSDHAALSNLALTVMAAGGAAGLHAGYRWNENRKLQSVVDKARKERDAARAMGSPQSVSVSPVLPRALETRPDEHPDD
jgi:hypothetical protein